MQCIAQRLTHIVWYTVSIIIVIVVIIQQFSKDTNYKGHAGCQFWMLMHLPSIRGWQDEPETMKYALESEKWKRSIQRGRQLALKHFSNTISRFPCAVISLIKRSPQ